MECDAEHYIKNIVDKLKERDMSGFLNNIASKIEKWFKESIEEGYYEDYKDEKELVKAFIDDLTDDELGYYHMLSSEFMEWLENTLKQIVNEVLGEQ